MPTINKKTEEEVIADEFNNQYEKMWKMVNGNRNLQDISNKEFIREVEEFIASHK